MNEIEITDFAAKHILKLISAEVDNDALRIEVKGGGCSGFQYEYSLTNEMEPGDLEFKHNGARVLVDNISINYLKGSTIDYTDSLIESSFKITNPNASSSCGCGVSFTI